jgi:hypothetical protein
MMGAGATVTNRCGPRRFVTIAPVTAVAHGDEGQFVFKKIIIFLYELR